MALLVPPAPRNTNRFMVFGKEVRSSRDGSEQRHESEPTPMPSLQALLSVAQRCF